VVRFFVLAVVLVACAAPAPAATATPRAPVAATVPASRSATATTTPRASPTPEPTGIAKCAASDLRAVAAWQQTADGAMAGAIFLANRGVAPCTLRGNPQITLLGIDGSALDVRGATVTAGTPVLVVVPVTQFREDPAGLDGVGASAPLQWSNYCGAALPVRFRITLAEDPAPFEGSMVDITGRPVTSGGTPRCNDGAGPSTLAVYPFQEPRR
jgi:hypothetical protein